MENDAITMTKNEANECHYCNLKLRLFQNSIKKIHNYNIIIKKR